MAGSWVQILAMALRRVHLCHWCSCGGNWCLNWHFQRQRIEMWYEKCFMTPFWRKIYLSRLPLQESHKCVRGCKKRFRKAVRVQVLFCFTLYKGNSLLSVAGLVAQAWVFGLLSPVFEAEMHRSPQWHWDISTPHQNEPISYVLEAWEQTAVA